MDLSRMRPCCRVVAAFFLLTVALRAPADPLILHAHACEKAGDLEASAALLSMWLASNPAASGSPAVYLPVTFNSNRICMHCLKPLGISSFLPGGCPGLLFNLTG